MIIKTNNVDLGVLADLRNLMTAEINHSSWKLKKSKSQNYLVLYQNGAVWMSDNYQFIEKYYTELYNRPFTSILCAGLGLGIIPYLSQSFCTKIDVVEISQSNIEIINQNTNYLNQNVNIINDDINTYNTNEMYDIILIDIWDKVPPTYSTEKNSLTNKFSKNLNPSGFIYFPIEQF